MSGSTQFFESGSRATNPFSTRWVRPGAIAYQFPRGASAAQLVQQLRDHAWRGAVVGPHGSGKSTLLSTLIPVIEQSGRAVRSVTLHDGQRNLPRDFAQPTPQDSPGVVVVDGYEQLGRLARWKLKACCRRAGWGLLLTTHREAAARGIPMLFRTSPDLATVEQLIEQYLPPHDGLIEPDDIPAAFFACQGNVRETLFTLYDLFEHRRRTV